MNKAAVALGVLTLAGGVAAGAYFIIDARRDDGDLPGPTVAPAPPPIIENELPAREPMGRREFAFSAAAVGAGALQDVLGLLGQRRR